MDRSTAEALSAALDVLEVPLDARPDEAVLLDIEREASALGETELEMRARLVRARAVHNHEDPATVAALLWEVNDWATKQGNRVLLAESHRQFAGVYFLLGDPGTGLDHAVRAMELLDDTTPPRVRAESVSALAMALSVVGSCDAARERYAEAEQIFTSGQVTDGSAVCLLMYVLNNQAFNEHLAGEHERAWASAERMLALAAAEQYPMNASFVHTVSLAQIGLGRLAEAERTLQTSLDDYDFTVHSHSDDLSYVLLSLAEVQRRRGATEQAQLTLDRCREFCTDRGVADVKLRVQQEQAELYAAIGEPYRAFEAYKAFHAESEAVNLRERSAQARIRQAALETTEARQQAERFREQARRDPLTGLRNRRFVDEELPALLLTAAEAGTSLSLALVDLDHFKPINDALSHDVGDQVLVMVGGLIAASIAGPITATGAAAKADGFVARMGGDEFLVVLPGLSPEQAAGRLEAVRVTAASYHWEPITGDLPVTVSIGAAAAHPDGETQSDLLRRADQNLYAAKTAGRDRVVAGRDPSTESASALSDPAKPPAGGGP